MSIGSTKRSSTFKYIVNVLARRIWMLIIPLLIIPVIMTVGSYYLEPLYLSETIVSLGGRFQVDRTLENMLGYDPNLIGRQSNRRSEIQSIYREITSTPYLQQLGILLGLDQNPEIRQQAALLKAQRPRMSDDDAMNKVISANLKDKITVRWAGENQVGIRAFSEDPHMAYRMSRYLTDIFIREQVRSKVGAMRYTEDFSWEQLEKYDRTLQEKLDEKTALDAEFARIQVDSVIETPENRRGLTFDIETARTEISSLENDLERLKGKISGIPETQLNINRSEEIVRDLTEIDRNYSSYLDLVLEYPWNSYEIFRVKNRAVDIIDKIKAKIDNAIETKFDDKSPQIREILKEYFLTRANLKAERLNLDYLTRAEEHLVERLTIIPGYQAKYDQLEREIAAARDIRDQFRQQQESNLITQAILRESEYKIIQAAEVPLRPVKPDEQFLVVLSIVLALMVGIATITFSEIYSGAFRRGDEIEKELGLPIVGIIPSIKSVKKIETV